MAAPAIETFIAKYLLLWGEEKGGRRREGERREGERGEVWRGEGRGKL